jgi:hypothetical protein
MEKGLYKSQKRDFRGDENILDARCLGVNRFAPERIQSLVERKVVGVDLPCGRRKKDVLAVLTGLISV